ncbi:MAG: L-Ala-D/L-Glu epimerase [Roseibium sp.]|nr:L-Ala-D/L-Glu epimerase [Roseibium sp.]
MKTHIEIIPERYEIAGGFAISRGSRTHAEVLVVKITRGRLEGRGECVPYPRYGESLESVQAQIADILPDLEAGASRRQLQKLLPAGAARNAVDCALWDLEAKESGRRAWQLAGIEEPRPLETAFTISVGTPDAMAAATAQAAHRPLLKIKLAGDGDPERIAAVREAAPHSALIIDANEAWTQTSYGPNMTACSQAGVALIEQPLPADADHLLESVSRPVPVCADESLHTSEDLADLRRRYDAVNIKLDKAGGLSEALVLAGRARAMDFKIMVGCMLGTSLAMAPAVLVAQTADYVDLDGPLLLTRDREPGLRFDGSTVYPPDSALWG